MENHKKPEFVVTDRRKFNVDGEPRPGAPADPETKAAAPVETNASRSAVAPLNSTASNATPAASKPGATKAEAGSGTAPVERFVPEPITETGYNGEMERTAFGGQKMEFIHLLDMLVQTAMMYAGAMEGGAERRVDIVGLRQMIDLISILEAKTKGNLTEQEQALLTNTMFQLRMTYMELVNMIDREALKKAPGAPGPRRK